MGFLRCASLDKTARVLTSPELSSSMEMNCQTIGGERTEGAYDIRCQSVQAGEYNCALFFLWCELL